jgi:isoleucyl-tRNA synthetase
VLGVSPECIIEDARLGEWQVGTQYHGKPIDDFLNWRRSQETSSYFVKTIDGESYQEVVARAGACLHDIDKTYTNKNILIISHGSPLRALELISQGFSLDTQHAQISSYNNFKNAEIRKIDFVPLPHNENFELDLHKPYIDEVELVDEVGHKMTRVKEVMDVWFDSGAMPFAQDHYPFEGTEVAYPADFICEAIDQTRGWFYTLHAVGTILGRGKAYKNVICLGHILDAQGKKMSKSLGNIVDPWEMMEKYGVDPLRFWMYTVNQPGEPKNFDEKTVLEISRKVFTLLDNVVTFYELYRDTTLETNAVPTSTNVLDTWIIAKLSVLTKDMTENLDAYKLLEPGRALRDFIDDLSTWYLRRSRERLKDVDIDSIDAKKTLYFVLKTVSKLLAPMAPFMAESLYQKLRIESDPESVHLENWPQADRVNRVEIIEEMKKNS